MTAHTGQFLEPDWPTPPGVQALMTLRGSGHSVAPCDSFNLSMGVGDDPQAVLANRQVFVQHIGARPTWMRQVHGRDVLRLTQDTSEHPDQTADAAWTTERGLACMVGAADCMPVLFALRDGSAVAAAHAGWRGLAAGVLEATVQALCAGTGAMPQDLQAWLGPCIGPRQFEVGEDVLQGFGADPQAADPLRFIFSPRPDGSPRWRANLPQLAFDRLAATGLVHITRADTCTVEDPSRFFSFRRDRVTGRMVAAIWRV